MIYRFFHWDIPATTHREFVRRLWSSSWTQALKPTCYMNEVAERAYKVDGKLLRTYNERVFVNDLRRAGYLEILNVH